MSEDMNLSINGQSQVPPGFRFHPTEEELLHYYLRKKVAFEKIDLDVIREVDLNKLEPWDIQEKCKIGSTPQNDWYFFSHKDKKYPTGTRTNRATAAGFWKATGRDKIIYSGFRRIGLRKTLVFYKGRAPHGQKSDWIMHEYRLDDNTHGSDNNSNVPGSNSVGESAAEDGWVVCRVFRKKNFQKTLESPKSCSSISSMDSKMLCPGSDGVLDQILLYMGRNCKMETDPLNITSSRSVLSSINERFMHLPRLESPTLTVPSLPTAGQQSIDHILAGTDLSSVGCSSAQHNSETKTTANDWVALDRLVASQLNGTQTEEAAKQLSCFGDPNAIFGGLCHEEQEEEVNFSHLNLHRSTSTQAYNSESGDLWSFTKSSPSPSSSSDPLCHLSV